MIDVLSTCDLIILGASARAAAQSALRAGFQPWCADLFADSDLCAVAPVVRCATKDYPIGLLKILREAPVPSTTEVLLTGALENHTDLIKAISVIHPLLGTSAEAIRRVRNPDALLRIPRHPGLRRCSVWRRRPPLAWLDGLLLRRKSTPRYLLKPLGATGGRGIRPWIPMERIGQNHMLQRYVAGRSISAVYRADGKRVQLVGVTEQILGDVAFGVGGFQYCGSVGPIDLRDRQHDALVHLGAALLRVFSLRSVFGVDAVIDETGDIWPIEVNPRYTASMEILERAGCGPVLLPWHVAGAKQKSIPCDARDPQGGFHSKNHGDGEPVIHAKAIVFATHDVRVKDLLQIFEREQIADIPSPGDSIHAGWPICTLLTHSTDSTLCIQRLHTMVQRLDLHLSRQSMAKVNATH